MDFVIDPRIASTCFKLADWPLSRVFLKNNADYPWFILVPRVEHTQDLDELPNASRMLLMQEITTLSSIVKSYFNPDKLNVGALGNIVPQLHIHVIARFTHDPLWPHGVWQADLTHPPYDEAQIRSILEPLCAQIEIQAKKITLSF